ncbi:putative Endonuclease/exonuclease/phosphatase superfamily [Dioscorea sansibarensis]
MARFKLDLICLVETKASPERVYRFCSRIMHRWEWVAIHSPGLSGGILVLWKKKTDDVTLVVTSRFALHLVITAKDQSSVLTTIYNSQDLPTLGATARRV